MFYVEQSDDGVLPAPAKPEGIQLYRISFSDVVRVRTIDEGVFHCIKSVGYDAGEMPGAFLSPRFSDAKAFGWYRVMKRAGIERIVHWADIETQDLMIRIFPGKPTKPKLASQPSLTARIKRSIATLWKR